MIGRLLIDECLSPDLVQLAVDAGHVESTCVRNRGLLGRKDWSLFEYLLEHDFILVTLNAHRIFAAMELATPVACMRTLSCIRA
jgi:predicted nuclease of predicted toxin-antitoxin system